jgi:hypothetical protein
MGRSSEPVSRHGSVMKDETGERCVLSAKQAQTEQDPEKFMKIIEEINRLLEEKEQRLRNHERKNQQDKG